MTAYVLTWNPARSAVDDVRWARWVGRMDAGDQVRVAWRMGATRHGVTAGQPVWLLRQGTRGRGLVGRGLVEADGVHPDDEWDGVGRPAYHVRVAFTAGVDPADAIGVDELELVTRRFDWRHVYASGNRLDDVDDVALARRWDSGCGG